MNFTDQAVMAAVLQMTHEIDGVSVTAFHAAAVAVAAAVVATAAVNAAAAIVATAAAVNASAFNIAVCAAVCVLLRVLLCVPL